MIIDNGLNDIRIIGSITLVVLACIVSIGMEWEAKVSIFTLINENRLLVLSFLITMLKHAIA